MAWRSRDGGVKVSSNLWTTPQSLSRQLLAAARSRSGSDSPPDCHSLPSRRFATYRGAYAISSQHKFARFYPVGRCAHAPPPNFCTNKKQCTYRLCFRGGGFGVLRRRRSGFTSSKKFGIPGYMNYAARTHKKSNQ